MQSSNMRLKRVVDVLLVLVLSVFLISGCGTKEKTYQDSLGNDIVLKGTPKRIVSLSPALTEIVFALGAGDRLVGVTNYCNRPEDAQKIEKVGDAFNLNLEKLVSLKPDLVLIAGTRDQESQNQKDMRRLEIPAYSSGPSTVEEVFSDIESLSKVLGVDAEGEALVERLRGELDSVLANVAADPADRPSVFVAIDQDLWTVGPGSFIDEAVSLAGGRNVVDDVDLQYLQISMEDLLQRNPDVILIAIPEEVAGPLLARPGWGVLKAVSHGKVFFVNPDLISRPSPAVIEGIKELASLFRSEK
ncbi:MAG: ABC transporter substrate-binding protein [Bacillota bacterium]|jgi:iron complex transport system substrate-binding protein